MTRRREGPVFVVAPTTRSRRAARSLPWIQLSGRVGDVVRDRWGEASGFVLFCAVPAAVRIVAPLLSSKGEDPAVVCVDEACSRVVPLVGGHAAGANALARKTAALLGAEAVMTTATDSVGLAAFDDLPGFVAEGAVAEVTRRMLDGEVISVASEHGWPLPAIWENPAETASSPRVRVVEPARADVLITDHTGRVRGNRLLLHPPSLVLGIGCSTDAGADEAAELALRTLAEAGLAAASVGLVATIDRRATSPAVRETAARLGVDVVGFTADELAAVEVPNPSGVVMDAVGTGSVAEAAALSAAGEGAGLVVEKVVSPRVTVAVARRAAPVGELAVVGVGPGDPAHRTCAAEAAIGSAEVVVGYGPYLDLVADLLRPGQLAVRSPIGEEVGRAESAVEHASKGRVVALVCSGDPGVYGMASLALETAARRGFDLGKVKIVPGVTAAYGCGALVGAPFAHDHAVVSLSDLLTPWEVIEGRLSAVAEADMAVALYNPRSQGRRWQLGRAIEIFLGRRPADTPAAVVTDGSRPGETVTVTTLGELDPQRVSMRSLVIIGSSQTRNVGGRIVTPRGYQVR